MSKKKCPICGTEMKIDTSAVCTSIPPKYRCVCPSCNCLDFIKTSEYDQYKEEPSLPSDLDEAAKQIVIQKHPCMEDCLILGDRLTRGELIALVKAGAEWMAGQGYVDTHAVINEYEDWGDGFAKLELGILNNDDFFEDWQEPNEIIVQIRKKQ